VHVVDDDQPKSLIELECREAEKILNEQIVAMPELSGVRCRAVVTTGEGFDGVLRTAASAAADLIVMRSHRKQLLRDIFIGTTIERVIRTGPYPVLMVNADTGHPYRFIIAGVDMSDPSAHALRTAKALKLADDADLTVVHGFAADAKGKLYVASAPQDQIMEYVERERIQASAELRSFLTAQGLVDARWSYRVEEGSGFEVISRIVKETMPDLLIIGTHGRSGIARALIGSVAEEALRTLDVDILAVPVAR